MWRVVESEPTLSVVESESHQFDYPYGLTWKLIQTDSHVTLSLGPFSRGEEFYYQVLYYFLQT